MFKKFDNYDGVCFFNGLVFFAPVALFIRTHAGVSEAMFLLLQALLSIAIFIGEIPTGFITDKIGYKKSIVLSQLLMLMARLLIFAAFIYQSLWLFIIEAVVEGVANCFSSGTNSAYLYCIHGEDGFIKKSAHSANFGTAGFIISTLAYAWIYSRLGMTGLLAFTAVAGFAAFLFSLFLAQEIKTEKESSEKSSIKGLISIVKNRRARLYIVLLSLFSVAWLLINFFYVEKLELTGISVEWMSAIILIYSAVQMLAEPIIGKCEKASKSRLLVITGVISGIAMIMFGLVSATVPMLILMVIVPLIISLPEYFLMEQENKLVDSLDMKNNRAAALSVLNMGVNIVEIAALFASAALSGVGIIWCFLLVGIMIIGSVVLNFLKNNIDKDN